jgi:uncharacterized protein (TIGR02118 family)
MPKLFAFITARPDLSREAFVDYYETQHAPLVRRLLPMIVDYRRNYVNDDLLPFSDSERDYDVITEMWFESDEQLEAFWSRIRQPDVLAEIRRDEANFLISDRTRMIGADEFSVDIDPAQEAQ